VLLSIIFPYSIIYTKSNYKGREYSQLSSDAPSHDLYMLRNPQIRLWLILRSPKSDYMTPCCILKIQLRFNGLLLHKLFIPVSFSLAISLIFALNFCSGQVMVQEGDTSLQPEPSREGTSQSMTAMDVSEDQADEALLKLNEDELHNLQKENSIQCIEGMKISSKEASRFDIPLCRMMYMPLVLPTLAHDIKRLEAEFTHGYRPGAPMFYVSTYNENGDDRLVKDVDTSNWGAMV
jgi:hypothetical protein